jgi:hypothetical protein
MAVIGDTLRALLITRSLATQAAKDADALPTGLLRRNGTPLATAVTVDDVGLGRYLFTTNLFNADGWAQGDHYALEGTWTMEATADLAEVLAQGLILPSTIQDTPDVPANTLTIVRGDTVSLALPLLGVLTGYTEVWFTVKASEADSDDNAVLALKETVGLVRLNKAATTAGWGNLTVTSTVTGATTLGLLPEASSLLRPNARLRWDAQVQLPSGIFTRQSGILKVTDDITRAIE